MAESIPPPNPQPNQMQKPNLNPKERDVAQWQKFLSLRENSATKQEAQQFINGLLRFFNTLVARERARVSKANQRLKRVIKGEE